MKSHFHESGISRKMGLRHVEQGFSSIFAKFDDFSKFCSIFDLLYFPKNFKYCKKLVKNQENPFSTCLQPISHVPTTWVSGTHYPICHDSPNANIMNFDHAELLTFFYKWIEHYNFPNPTKNPNIELSLNKFG